MPNIISYCLFEQDKNDNDLNIRAGHDPFTLQKFRYWVNVPIIPIINKEYFSNFKTKIYCPKKIQNHPLYELLELLKNNFEFFELELIDKEYKKTEPSIWRMKALWEDNCNICFCRDIDSIISPKEAKCMNYFIKNDFYINNIRGLSTHNSEGTTLMAGLCGFKVDILKKELPLPKSFNNYLNYCDDDLEKSWGCDQTKLINFFIKNRANRILSKILDFYIQPNFRNPNTYKGPVKRSPVAAIISKNYNEINDEYDVNINKTILETTGNATDWIGEPIDFRKYYDNLFDLDIDNFKLLKNLLNNNKTLKNFYNI